MFCNSQQTAQHAAVSNLLRGQKIPIPQFWTDGKGNSYYFDHTNANGGAAIKITDNMESAETVGAWNLWPGGSSGFSLNGANILLAQWDGGDVLTNHQEFAAGGNRASLLDGPTSTGAQDHATHVAGTMVAYGVARLAIGFANRARLVESVFSNDLTEMPQVAANLNVRESNHSYGYGAGWAGYINFSGTIYRLWIGDPGISPSQSWLFGFYDDIAQANDEIIYTAHNYLPVFAAGNANGDEHGPDVQPVLHVEYINGVYQLRTDVRSLNDANGGYNTLTSYALSKNDLVVGAVYPNVAGYIGPATTTIAPFSSMGPTADGRIKPDVVADGVNVYSCFSSNTSSYHTDSGTSMAAPAVTGSLGLITELYNELYGTDNPPLASTLRGIMIHTADQLGANVGPSYTYGWGLIDPVAAANLVNNNYASQSLAFIKEVRLVSGDRIVFPVTLTTGVPFRATITWTDPPGTPVAPALNPTNHMLVNDLDLRVISPDGTTNFPYVLNPVSPGGAATQGDNTVDNVEQVYIPSPATGTYTLQVTHKGTLVDDQGQTSYQNVSVMLSGNVAQPPILPQITSIYPVPASSAVALAWASEVGRIYSVQTETDIASANWQFASAELSATKTNTAIVLPVSSTGNVFYRIVQIR